MLYRLARGTIIVIRRTILQVDFVSGYSSRPARGFLAFAVATLLTLITVGAAHAEPADTRLGDPDALVVGVEELDYAPHYTIASGSYRGFAREVFDTFAADEKLNITYRPLPVTRLHSALVTGQIDFKYPDNPLWGAAGKAASNVRYSHAVVDYIDGVMVPAERRALPVDGRVAVLAVVRGFTLPPAASWPGGVAPMVSEQISLSAAIREVLEGRAQGVFGNIAVMRHQLRYTMMYPADAMVFDSALPHDRGAYYVSSVKRPDLVERFDAWLKRNSPKLERLKLDLGVN